MKNCNRYRNIGAAACAFGITLFGANIEAADSYVAHEWGTFTSYQTSGGELLAWRPLETSILPGFVYDWMKPGYQRQCTSALGGVKAVVTTLQRMETPVIYFYAEKPLTVDVDVEFPKGLITEWYPQAAQIGPSRISPPWLVAKLDELAHKTVSDANFTFSSLMNTPAAPDSRVHWADVQILPRNPASGESFPKDTSGSHYFAARETESNPIRVPLWTQTNNAAQNETEKFLFYRGVGSFQTPLQVSLAPSGKWTLCNKGTNSISDLFLLEVRGTEARWQGVGALGAEENRDIGAFSTESWAAKETTAEKLGVALEHSLKTQGLYAAEAKAMVATWRDSWLSEDGIRVLYLLPRNWTDETLPIKLAPKPVELTRVMVGRSEILPSSVEERLVRETRGLGEGNSTQEHALVSDLAHLGRFAEPALQMATRSASESDKRRAWELLHLAAVEKRR